MAELFAVDVRTVSEHLKNVFASGELGEPAVVRKFRNTAADGKSYPGMKAGWLGLHCCLEASRT